MSPKESAGINDNEDMPMYDYRCSECGERYEQLRRMAEADSGLVCPRCGSERVERQISSCAIGVAGSSSSGGEGGGCSGRRGGFS